MTSAVPHWSGRNQDRAAMLLAAYPDPRSAIMPLLFLASQEHGSCTEEAMRDVSALVGLTAAQVQAVASFYTMFKRDGVGRYLLSVCTSISCFLLGADGVLSAIEEASGVSDGETGEDGYFTVEHVECIGACGGAPALQVNYELVEGVTVDTARGLCAWLREARPEVVLGDEMQQLFGGRRSFDWAIKEHQGAVAPVPAFGPYGSVGEEP